MSTVAMTCPYCGEWMRVAVQPSSVVKTEAWPNGPQLKIKFDDQTVAHICKEKKGAVRSPD